MLKILKQQAVTEDIELGFGDVTQTRDLDGVPTEIVYTKVSAETIPAKSAGGAEGTTQEILDEKTGFLYADAQYALMLGDSANTFSVAVPAEIYQATPKSYVDDEILSVYSQIDSNFALKTNVLTRDNVDIYVPSTQYHPATKRYVDETVVSIGAGDMAKATYDSNTNGIVDNAEALGVVSAEQNQGYKGEIVDANAVLETGIYGGDNIANIPKPGGGMVVVENAGGKIVQRFSVGGSTWSRLYIGDPFVWSPWQVAVNEDSIIDDLNSTNSKDALSANQGRILNDSIQSIEGVPLGTIILYHGQLSNLNNKWAFCDGGSGTPDLRDMFISGARDESEIGQLGGTLESTMPSHTHSANHDHTGSTDTTGSHKHSASHNHSASSNSTGSHSHSYVKPTGEGTAYQGSLGDAYVKSSTTGSSGDHSHTITVDTKSLYTSTTGNHSHTIIVNTRTFSTGVAGSAGDNRPPYYKLAYIMKIA